MLTQIQRPKFAGMKRLRLSQGTKCCTIVSASEKVRPLHPRQDAAALLPGLPSSPSADRVAQDAPS
jgi:hypothetical protein